MLTLLFGKTRLNSVCGQPAAKDEDGTLLGDPGVCWAPLMSSWLYCYRMKMPMS